MALQARIKHEDYYYYQDISSLDESVIQDARRSFDNLRASGTLRADSFESNQWIMTDGVRRAVTIDFQIDEVAFSRKIRQLLGCTLNDYHQAMRVAICCWFGYSLDTLQYRVNILRKFACGQIEITQYEDAQIILDMLLLLPGYTKNGKRTAVDYFVDYTRDIWWLCESGHSFRASPRSMVAGWRCKVCDPW